ncbi:Type 1 glutamine amidotransferase-like domain-containing protein [Kitasatospora sp. NPDC001664]
MRLYLSSFRLGDRPEELVGLLGRVGAGCPVGVVANAMDAAPGEVRRAGVEREFAALAGLGLAPVEVDLRKWFGGEPGALAEELARYPVVWVRGGNVFVLREALARSGADVVLTGMVRRDELVYAGYSAGPAVLGRSLRGLEGCDDPADVAVAYGDVAAVRWDGLGVLDYVVVPHVDSPGHPESEALGRVAAEYHRTGVPHRALRDGQALVVRGGVTTLHPDGAERLG